MSPFCTRWQQVILEITWFDEETNPIFQTGNQEEIAGLFSWKSTASHMAKRLKMAVAATSDIVAATEPKVHRFRNIMVRHYPV